MIDSNNRRTIRRILVENGSYDLSNFGDVAMLQHGVGQLRRRFPSALIDVITARPDRLARYCPGSRPVSPMGSFFPTFATAGFENSLVEVAPRLARLALWGMERVLKIRPKRDEHALMKMVEQADLVVSTGGGFVTDSFPGHGTGVLSTLNAAAKLGKITAMMGQGIGPFNASYLIPLAQETLGRMQLVALREKLSAPALLSRFGVSPERIVLTGDDAVGPAFALRRNETGMAIGVNLRCATYSGISLAATNAIRPILHAAARKFQAPLVPLPIANSRRGGDPVAIGELLAGAPIVARRGMDLVSRQPASPEAVMKNVSACRMIVTGSYHAAVFALSQGIPALTISKSAYYDSKFNGLCDMFAAGIYPLHLDDADFEQKLRARLEEVWEISPSLRPELLVAAQRQIQAGEEAYDRLADLAAVAAETTADESQRSQLITTAHETWTENLKPSFARRKPANAHSVSPRHSNSRHPKISA